MLTPLFRRVLLKREHAEKKGSIIIPKSAQLRHATLRCTVVAIGPDVNDKTVTNTIINVGDEVIITRHAGAWLDESGHPVDDVETATFYVIQDEDIICTVKEDE